MVAGVLLFDEAFEFSFCSEFKLSGSEILPPSKNLVGGMMVSLRTRLSGKKNFDRVQQKCSELAALPDCELFVLPLAVSLPFGWPPLQPFTRQQVVFALPPMVLCAAPAQST